MNKIIIAFTCLIIVLSSCNQNEDHSHDNSDSGHPHTTENNKDYANLEPLAYTLYSDNFELFVEFKPLVVGQESKFAAHFTKLGDQFTAVTKGKITLSLIGSKEQNIVSDAPSSPGIFRLALEPTTAGKNSLTFQIESEELSEKITIQELQVYSTIKEAQNNVSEAEEIDELVYLKEQAWLVEFANQKVIKKPFSEVIKTTGKLTAAQGDEMTLTAKSNGTISFGGNKKQIGSFVQNNETFLTISSNELIDGNLQQKYLDAKAQLDKTTKDLKRANELIVDRIITQKAYLDIELKHKEAQVNFATISKNYSKNGQKVIAPFKGYIKDLKVTEGQFVEIGQPIAIITQNKRLLLTAEIPQKHFGKLSSIQSANFKTAYSNKLYSVDELNGKLISYGKNTNDHTFHIPVNFEIDNKGDLISGAFVEVFLKTNLQNDVLAVPNTALMEEQGIFYVFVQTSGEGFQKREVKLGISDGQSVVVHSGIKENEYVVTKGAYQIKLATMSGELPEHGHEH